LSVLRGIGKNAPAVYCHASAVRHSWTWIGLAVLDIEDVNQNVRWRLHVVPHELSR
jgi:hypothetical protein